MIVKLYRQRGGEYIPRHSTDPVHQAYWREHSPHLAIEAPHDDGETSFNMFPACHLPR